MAWTTPASYSVGELVTASKLNLHVRDNLRYLKGLDGQVTLDSGLRIPGLLIAPPAATPSYLTLGDSAPSATMLYVSRTALFNGSIQIDSFLSDVGGAPMMLNSRFGGVVTIGTETPAGRLHVTQSPGGFIFVGLSGINATPQTIVSTGVNRRFAVWGIAYRSGGPSVTFNGGTNTGAGTYDITMDGGANNLRVTASAGALTIARTAGSDTWEVIMMAMYQ